MPIERRTKSQAGLLLAVVMTGAGCSQGASDSSPDRGGVQAGGALGTSGGSLGLGGAPTSGGNAAAGASTALGGSRNSGGALASGGKSATGGTTATGGKAAAGGTSSTGGTTASGGTSATGGTTATGGKSSGGITSVGGTTSKGGASSGGATGKGGSTGQAGGSAVPSVLIGWAATNNCGAKGTTGGGDGPATIVVTTTAALEATLRSTGPAVIEVRGEMQGVRLSESVGVKDKTLIGTNGAFIKDGLRIDAGSNLIFKNIRFGQTTGRADLEDGFTVFNCKCVWIDHCEFMNSMDGNLDVVGGDGSMSDWVTVSWSKFWYTDAFLTVNPNHRLSNLNGPSAGDLPDMPNVTFHHNWWAENVTERMPRGRHGKIHVFNNYYSTQGNNYGIGGSDGVKFVVENNFFEPGFEDPIFYQNSDMEVVMSGNAMDGVVWKDATLEKAARGTAFKPSSFYSYTLQTAQEAKTSVFSNAGIVTK